jgi:hypothetical protein
LRGKSRALLIAIPAIIISSVIGNRLQTDGIFIPVIASLVLQTAQANGWLAASPVPFESCAKVDALLLIEGSMSSRAVMSADQCGGLWVGMTVEVLDRIGASAIGKGHGSGAIHTSG